jgi:hypothetical protein
MTPLMFKADPSKRYLINNIILIINSYKEIRHKYKKGRNDHFADKTDCSGNP